MPKRQTSLETGPSSLLSFRLSYRALCWRQPALDAARAPVSQRHQRTGAITVSMTWRTTL